MCAVRHVGALRSIFYAAVSLLVPRNRLKPILLLPHKELKWNLEEISHCSHICGPALGLLPRSSMT